MTQSYVAEMYRERADECFRLARADDDMWVVKALENLAYSMLQAADQVETGIPVSATPPRD